jgi:predicted Fe-Mo cluster-binding NifX family protein
VKIAIPVTESDGLGSEIYDHFGSAPYFAIIESDDRTVQLISNANAEHKHGACSPMMALASKHIDAVIVKGIGRNAFIKLHSAGIRVYTSDASTVGIAMDKLVSGELEEFDVNRTCEGHTVP